jgi:hypothetical protein
MTTYAAGSIKLFGATENSLLQMRQAISMFRNESKTFGKYEVIGIRWSSELMSHANDFKKGTAVCK